MPGRAPKKAKLSKNAPENPLTTPASCFFTKLPLELVAEILLYTNSPRDVLSLSRCNKFYYDTLLQETNQFIWRYVRRNFKVPLPDPCSWFTEASYAAFVFDDGVCECCNKRTNSMFSSFALRARLCSKETCKMQFVNTKLIRKKSIPPHQRAFSKILPSVETNDCLPFHENPSDTEWPSASSVFRHVDWLNALQDYLNATRTSDLLEQFTDKCAIKAARTEEFMRMCVALHNWKAKFGELSKEVETFNKEFARKLAEKEGIDRCDLRNAPTFDTLFKNRNKILEKMVESEYRSIQTAVEAELLKVKEKRSRRAHEQVHRNALAIVEKHYNRLQAEKREYPLPSLSAFRDLPIIRQLQCTAEARLDKQLQAPVIQSLIHSQLAQLNEQAKRELGAILGFPGWKSPSEKKLHPVDRLTARFRCQACNRVGLKYKEDECLDFIGAWSHTCTFPPDKKVSSKHGWKSGRFVLDEKAITAMTKLLQLCGISSEEMISNEAVRVIGTRVLCLDCDGQIVMDFKSVVGHSHRHDNMSMLLISEADAPRILVRPISRGLAVRLLGTEKKAREFRQWKVYGCRHCSQARDTLKARSSSNITASVAALAPVPAAPSVAGEAGGEPAQGLPKEDKRKTPATLASKQAQSLYNFDGLRSHLSGKHKISNPRDEDFFCVERLDWSINKK